MPAYAPEINTRCRSCLKSLEKSDRVNETCEDQELRKGSISSDRLSEAVIDLLLTAKPCQMLLSSEFRSPANSVARIIQHGQGANLLSGHAVLELCNTPPRRQ